MDFRNSAMDSNHEIKIQVHDEMGKPISSTTLGHNDLTDIKELNTMDSSDSIDTLLTTSDTISMEYCNIDNASVQSDSGNNVSQDNNGSNSALRSRDTENETNATPMETKETNNRSNSLNDNMETGGKDSAGAGESNVDPAQEYVDSLYDWIVSSICAQHER